MSVQHLRQGDPIISLSLSWPVQIIFAPPIALTQFIPLPSSSFPPPSSSQLHAEVSEMGTNNKYIPAEQSGQGTPFSYPPRLPLAPSPFRPSLPWVRLVLRFVSRGHMGKSELANSTTTKTAQIKWWFGPHQNVGRRSMTKSPAHCSSVVVEVLLGTLAQPKTCCEHYENDVVLVNGPAAPISP